LGYPSGNEVNMAMDAGEIQGRTNQWTSWQTQRPDWIATKKVNFLLQIGPREPELPQVPVFLDLVTTARDKAMVRLLQTNQLLGRSVYAPPGIPADRIAALRDAFDKTMQDPEFLERVREAGLRVKPLSGAALAQELTRAMINVEQAAHDFEQVLHL
jgi:hypothetical protein